MNKFVSAAVALSIVAVSSLSNAETKIGVILPMTGDFARYGDTIREGLERVRTADVTYVYEDEGCHPKTAVSAFHKLRSVDNISLFLGPWCGSPQVAVSNLLQQNNSVAVLGSSAPEKVFKLSRGRMFSTQTSIESESRFNAEEAYRLGARKLVVVYFENDFSKAHDEAFRASFKGEVIESVTYASADAATVRSLATRIKRLKPDTLYVPDAFPFLHGLSKQLSSLGMGELPIMSVYSAKSQDVANAVGNYKGRFLISYPRIEGEALHTYPQQAGEVLLKAVAKCKESTTPDCVKLALESDNPFNKVGVLRGELALKELRDGIFLWFSNR